MTMPIVSSQFLKFVRIVKMGDYVTDYQSAVETGLPWIVTVSEPWCGPCNQMKQKLKSLEDSGKKFIFTVLPTADEKAKQIMGDAKGIPTWVIWKFDKNLGKFKKLHKQTGISNLDSVLARYLD